MSLIQQKIPLIFRYLWLTIAAGVILYLIQQNVVLDKQLVYQVALDQTITQNIEGPYPAQRVAYQASNNSLAVLTEPLYLQAYLPVEFKSLQVAGEIELNDQVGRLGLKQLDNSWAWQDLTNGSFNLTYDLVKAAAPNNRLELIFSFPDLTQPGEIVFSNLVLTLDR